MLRLYNQMRRCSVSISSTISEGTRRRNATYSVFFWLKNDQMMKRFPRARRADYSFFVESLNYFYSFD
jgi:hypothetical protein